MTRLIAADALLHEVAQLRAHTIRSETQDALEAIQVWAEQNAWVPDPPVECNHRHQPQYPGQPGTRTVAFSAAALLVHVVIPGRTPLLLAGDHAPLLDQLTERDREVALALLRTAASEIQQ